jgi:hypothetical protein
LIKRLSHVSQFKLCHTFHRNLPPLICSIKQQIPRSGTTTTSATATQTVVSVPAPAIDNSFLEMVCQLRTPSWLWYTINVCTLWTSKMKISIQCTNIRLRIYRSVLSQTTVRETNSRCGSSSTELFGEPSESEADACTPRFVRDCQL